MILTINTNDTSLYPLVNPTSATITVNGTTITGTTGSFTIPNNTQAFIVISKNGHNVYSNAINVFSYNKTINIFLTTIGDTTSYPSFCYFIEPCTFNIHCYSTTSIFSGSPALRINWIVDGNTLSNSYNFVYSATAAGSVEIVLENIIASSVTSTQQIDLSEYRPYVGLSAASASGCANDTVCFSATAGYEVTVTPDIVLNLTNTFISCDSSVLTYNLYDYNGNLIDTQVYLIDNLLPVIDPNDFLFTFTPDIIGDYKVTCTLENCCSQCTTELNVKVCDTIKVNFQSCNSYTISNCSLTDTIYFTLLNTNNEIVNSYEDIAVPPTATGSFLTPSDGVYNLVVNNNDQQYIYVVIAYCGIQSCLINRISDILCQDCSCGDDCKDYCKDRYELNRILPLVYAIFSYVNREYALNRVYNVLDDEKVVELLNVQTLIDTVNKFCSNCTTSSTTASSVIGNSTNSDCGCGCS